MKHTNILMLMLVSAQQPASSELLLLGGEKHAAPSNDVLRVVYSNWVENFDASVESIKPVVPERASHTVPAFDSEDQAASVDLDQAAVSSPSLDQSASNTEQTSEVPFADQLKKLGKDAGFLAHDSDVDETSEDIIIVRDPVSKSVICLSSRGKYRVSRVKPTCEDETQEFYRRACYKKCSLLTDGEYPFRVGMTACAKQGCDEEVEERWNDKCLAKCSLLTNGMYPRRIAGNTCALSTEECSWSNAFHCYNIRGLLPGQGHNVGGDMESAPSEYTEYMIRAWYKDGRTPMTPKCQDRELLLDGYCQQIVSCPVLD